MKPPDISLEAELRALRSVVAWPEEQDHAPAVGRRLRAGRGAPERVARRPRWLHPALVTAVIAVVAVAATLVASPGARRAVADWLGLSGLRIERSGEENLPSPAAEPNLGSRVSLREASEAAGWDLVRPATGAPDEIYLERSGAAAIVTFVYRSDDGGIDLLLTQFEGGLERELVAKVLGPGVGLRGVTVDGEDGYWITGSPHVLLYLDQLGRVREDTIRLAGDTLAWERGELTLRLEGAGSLGEALEIARAVRRF